MIVWEHVRQFLDILGWISTAIVLIASLYAGYLCVTGFVPVLIRLGNGLKRRKIAIFAKGDSMSSLEALFKDSDLFNTKNIIHISDSGDFGRADKASVFLVHWPDWPDDMPRIVTLKKDRTALVVYAPQGKGFLPPATMELLEGERNVVLANFRGRLLNDIVVSLITTGYDKG